MICLKTLNLILKNLRIKFASYLFSDKNKDSEGKTEFKWYADGKMISKGKSLILTSEMKGKEI